MSGTHLPEAFILDFDGTITKDDTIDAIFKSAVAFQDARGKDMSRVWQEIVVKYGKDYQTHVEAYEHAEEATDIVEEEIKLYRSLAPVEEKSFNRVSNSGIFAGIDEQVWEYLGSQAVKNGDVVVREGFEAFLGCIEKAKATWSIVSVNFSRAFIRGVLNSSITPGSSVAILANQPNENGVLKGPWGRVMTSSSAKLDAVQSLIGGRDSKPRSRVVYIGDSGTDIECLLADGVIGLIISEDGRSSLLRALRRSEMNILHIGQYEVTAPRTVYWARDYLEIVQSPLLS
jgi:thiamine phosphate phosphatase / amino-HMP aminohydrolase